MKILYPHYIIRGNLIFNCWNFHLIKIYCLFVNGILIIENLKYATI